MYSLNSDMEDFCIAMRPPFEERRQKGKTKSICSKRRRCAYTSFPPKNALCKPSLHLEPIMLARIHMISFPCNTSTATIAPTTTTRKTPQNAQQIQARCRALRCWLSSHESLMPALASSSAPPAVTVVQNRNAPFGLPDSETPSESREALACLEKREMRFEGGEGNGCAKCVDLGVGGREGGCEERAKRKREALLLARLLDGGVSAARAKCVEWGVDGAGVCAECGYEGSLCRAIISGVFASSASK